MEELIERFYTAFQQRDWQTMQSFYDENATFSDPVFPALNSKQTRAMWHMLTSSAANLKISFRVISASKEYGKCDWEAIYDFSRTGRQVHNKISASFTFLEGKIISHHDRFNIWRWSGMAIGASGWLLGWTPIIKNEIRKNADKTLRKFIADNPNYQ
jgi:ketosteroid isomerase-like protein